VRSAPFDAGFDEKVAVARHIVSGVSAGSSAYRAGLRDGQRQSIQMVERLRADARRSSVAPPDTFRDEGSSIPAERSSRPESTTSISDVWRSCCEETK